MGFEDEVEQSFGRPCRPERLTPYGNYTLWPLARILDVPFTMADATTLSRRGSRGYRSQGD